MLVLEDLVDEPVLDVDPARVRAAQVTDELLERRRRAERILFERAEKRLRFGSESGGRQELRVLLRSLRVDEPPAHQSSLSSSESTGVAMPSTIESRMPGIETR